MLIQKDIQKFVNKLPLCEILQEKWDKQVNIPNYNHGITHTFSFNSLRNFIGTLQTWEIHVLYIKSLKYQSCPLLPHLRIPSVWYRPCALTSRLHNNDAMLGVKTCRAARTCCAGRALALSASQSVRYAGRLRRYDMQGLARWLHAWRWRTWQCLVWPPTRGGALLWRHMHKVYYYFWILELLNIESVPII